MKLIVMREFIILNNMRILRYKQETTKNGKKTRMLKQDLTEKLKKAKTKKLI